MLKKIIIGFGVVLIIIQFFRIDKTNPPVDATIEISHVVDIPTPVHQILKSACFDCHSNTTVYPWYTNVAPLSWWIKDHIDKARDELNFSEWGSFSDKRRLHKIEEMGEMVKEGEMPLKSYILAHKEADLSKAQREIMLEWIKTLK